MNPATFTLAILQLNLRVGELGFNKDALLRGYAAAVADGATLVVAPELALSGYPPKDNLLHKAFVAMCVRLADEVAAAVGDVPLAFGTPLWAPTKGDYGQLATNSYVVAHRGQIVFRTDKRYLAQGGVFDEWRVHVPGAPKVWAYQGVRFGFPICEDIWHESVVADLMKLGAEVLLVPNGSPTYVGKPLVRQRYVRDHVAKTGKPMLYFNHVGGQDEHVFDGGAFFYNPGDTQATTCTPYWQESLGLVQLHRTPAGVRLAAPVQHLVPSDEAFVLDAVVLGTRDYMLKSSSLRKVVIGISGGVDSAVVLGLAVLVMRSAGLNPAEHIVAVSMPSKHNSATTKGFAEQVCKNLGIPLIWWPIGEAVTALNEGFAKTFGDVLKTPGNVAYENTQSRERGQVLMMLANRYNALLLSTGNKSEMAMGYATLYGDMNGGFNPLKTLYKTQVYTLGHTINQRLGFEAIPVALIHQMPSAELDDNQLDENSLPPYPVLDAILTRFMDERLDVAEIVGGPTRGTHVPYTVVHFPLASDGMWKDMSNHAPMRRFGFAGYNRGKETDDYFVHPDCVLAVVQRLLGMRFKRYQACPGVTITPSSFDDGEKYPLANGLAWLTEPLVLAG